MAALEDKQPPKARHVSAPGHLSNETAAHFHAFTGKEKELGRCIAARADVEGKSLLNFYSPPLHLACAAGHFECAKLLLERSVSVPARLPFHE